MADPNLIGDSLTKVFRHAQKLGLGATCDKVISIIGEISKSQLQGKSPEEIKRHAKGMEFKGELTTERAAFHMESLYETILSELRQLAFRAIPRERVQYADSRWLKDSPIQDKFPTSYSELERSGTCFALGEPTACVMHCMRALEPAIQSLAIRFGLPHHVDCWQTIITSIEKAVRQIGEQKKSAQKIADETFFGNAVSQLYFVKNAWRNHVAHGRETYSDTQALKIMQHTANFVESLCERLSEGNTVGEDEA